MTDLPPSDLTRPDSTQPDSARPDFPEIGIIQPDWPAPANVRAFTTSRYDGFSQGRWGRLNLGDRCGDDPQQLEQNRELLYRMLPCEPRWLKQVHGRRVLAWDESSDSEPEADAIFSERAGQVCVVLTADCLPVLFCNRTGTKVAAAHAGWRGLAAGVLQATIAAMACDPGELITWLGPAIGPRVYEVGEEVYDLFVNLNAENATAFKRFGDRWLADLYQLARLALSGAGVERVSGGQFCTWSEPDRFFSYRRDGKTGRMASIIWLEK